jgi:Mn2+/Fe2+ NRAMP family transporter
MAAMMILVSRRSVMARFTGAPTLMFLGWTATAAMGAAAIALIAQAARRW